MFSFGMKAQKPYVPMSNVNSWYVHAGDSMNETEFWYKDVGSVTLPNGMEYRVIEYMNPESTSWQKLIREDQSERKVYVFDGSDPINPEKLYYDFSLEEGDVFDSNRWPGETFTCISKDSIQSQIGTLYTWFIQNDLNITFKYTECIGADDLFYEPYIDDPIYSLRCAYNECEQVFGQDSCHPLEEYAIKSYLTGVTCPGLPLLGFDESGNYLIWEDGENGACDTLIEFSLFYNLFDQYPCNSYYVPYCPTPADSRENCGGCEMTNLIQGVSGVLPYRPNNDIQEGQPSPLCNGSGIPNNMVWYAFTAGSESLDISITTDNCNRYDLNIALPGSVQSGVFDFSRDEEGKCMGGNTTCDEEHINYTVNNLIQGNEYFLYVDGCHAYVCDYTLKISNTADYEMRTPTQVCPSLIPLKEEQGVLHYCPDQKLNILACEELGSMMIDNEIKDMFGTNPNMTFIWSFDPPIPSFTETTFDFPTTGNQHPTIDMSELIIDQPYTICLKEVFNSCDTVTCSDCCVTIVSDPSASNTIDLSEIQIDSFQYEEINACVSILPSNVYCKNKPITLITTHPMYTRNAGEWTWTIESLGDPVSAGSIRWEAQDYSATGFSFTFGSESQPLLGIPFQVSISRPEKYQLCVTDLNNPCQTAINEACYEFEIVDYKFLDYGRYEVCITDLEAGWEPDSIVNGVPWTVGPIFPQDVIDFNSRIRRSVNDECGCRFEQRVTIDVVDFRPFYEDMDQDGYGNPDQLREACFPPMGMIRDDQDCDDTNPNINPGAIEILDNDIDEDCNGIAEMTVGTMEIDGITFEIYPNPVEDILNIESSSRQYHITIFNTQGQVVVSRKNNQGNYQLDLSALSAGVYYILIRSDGDGFAIDKLFKL